MRRTYFVLTDKLANFILQYILYPIMKHGRKINEEAEIKHKYWNTKLLEYFNNKDFSRDLPIDEIIEYFDLRNYADYWLIKSNRGCAITAICNRILNIMNRWGITQRKMFYKNSTFRVLSVDRNGGYIKGMFNPGNPNTAVQH